MTRNQQSKLAEIRPQPGPQSAFLSSPADIGIYGGSAGSGKTYGLLLEPLRHVGNPRFNAVCFRRTFAMVRQSGGIWDASEALYPRVGGVPSTHTLRWRFPSGAEVSFGHLELEVDKLNWQGAELPLIMFDELTHFDESQFWYLTSRNRSVAAGIRAYTRATTNADADSWVAKLIAWWIGDDGFPIKERSGRLRWFIRDGDELVWSDSKEELLKSHGPDCGPRSLTFVGAKLSDNPILMRADPNYISTLKGLPLLDRRRLLDGDWAARPSAGQIFKRSWFEVVDSCPQTGSVVRYWDRASSTSKSADFTAGLKMRRDYKSGLYFVEDVRHLKASAAQVEAAIRATASQDGHRCPIFLELDPGQAGQAEFSYLSRQLGAGLGPRDEWYAAGYEVRSWRPTGDKVTRCGPLSAQAEQGRIKLVKGSWDIEGFLRELDAFPSKGVHDDRVDSCSGAFSVLSQSRPICLA